MRGGRGRGQGPASGLLRGPFHGPLLAHWPALPAVQHPHPAAPHRLPAPATRTKMSAHLLLPLAAPHSAKSPHLHLQHHRLERVLHPVVRHLLAVPRDPGGERRGRQGAGARSETTAEVGTGDSGAGEAGRPSAAGSGGGGAPASLVARRRLLADVVLRARAGAGMLQLAGWVLAAALQGQHARWVLPLLGCSQPC